MTQIQRSILTDHPVIEWFSKKKKKGPTLISSTGLNLTKALTAFSLKRYVSFKIFSFHTLNLP